MLSKPVLNRPGVAGAVLQTALPFKSYGNFAEKNEFFLSDKLVKLAGGGSVINGA